MVDSAADPDRQAGLDENEPCRSRGNTGTASIMSGELASPASAAT